MKKVIFLNFGNGRRVPCDAHVFGDWAIHRMHFGICKGYRVTHATSGFAIARLVDDLNKPDAIRIAKALRDRMPVIPLTALDMNGNGNAKINIPDIGHIAQAIVAEALMGAS